jgi:hypothetical protein
MPAAQAKCHRTRPKRSRHVDSVSPNRVRTMISASALVSREPWTEVTRHRAPPFGPPSPPEAPPGPRGGFGDAPSHTRARREGGERALVFTCHARAGAATSQAGDRRGVVRLSRRAATYRKAGEIPMRAVQPPAGARCVRPAKTSALTRISGHQRWRARLYPPRYGSCVCAAIACALCGRSQCRGRRARTGEAKGGSGHAGRHAETADLLRAAPTFAPNGGALT